MVASVTALAAGHVDYYLSLADERGGDGYYQSNQQYQGAWVGEAAKILGLGADVKSSDLRALFLGRSPEGKALVQNAGKEDRRAAVDITFSMPKSCSVLYAIADEHTRRVIEDIQRDAVEETIRFFENNFAHGRFGKAGAEREKGFIVGARFFHPEARAAGSEDPAPQLHTHFVCCNVTVTATGRTGALDTSQFFYQKMLLGAYYRCQLSHGFEARLGARLKRHKSWFEIEGVPQKLCQEFSPRRREILEHLASKGLSSAQASAVAALETRQNKVALPIDHLRARWQEKARYLGFTWDQGRRLIGHRTERDTDQAFREALSAALKHLTAEHSHFSQRDLLRAALEQAQARGLSSARVERGVAEAIEHCQDIVRLGRRGDELRFTTPEMLRVEKELLDGAGQLRDRSKLRVSNDSLARVLKSHPELTAEQQQAVSHVTTGADLTIVVGKAGSGKSTMLDAARAVWQQEGFRVIGAALSGKAAEGLEQSAKIASYTIAKLFGSTELGFRGDLEKGTADDLRHHAGMLVRAAQNQCTWAPQRERLDANSVLVIDEAGTVGSRIMKKIIDACQGAGCKLVLVGDPKQLQAVRAAGGPLASLAQRLGHAEITSIVRQRDPWARQAVAEFSRGEAAKGLLRYAERGLVYVAKTAEQAIRTLVATYAKDGLGTERVRDKLIFASTNREAASINQRVQRERLVAGELGRRVQVGSSYLHEQDRVLFTRNNRVLGVKNGMLGTVERVDFSGRSLAIRLDGEQRRLVHVSLRHYDHLQPGYAITMHRGQGCTTTNAFVLIGANTDLHLSYVAMSRARGDTRIFCDRREAGDELEHLAKSMARDRSKDLAHDVLRTHEPTHEYGRQLGRS